MAVPIHERSLLAVTFFMLLYVSCSQLLADEAILQEPSAVLNGHAMAVHSLAFTPNGKSLASIGRDNVLKIWDLTNQQPLVECKCDELAWNMALSPDGRIAASAGVGGNLQLWDVANGKLKSTIEFFPSNVA